MNPDFSPAEPEIECYGDGGPCESTAEGGWKIPEGETTCVYPELGGADCAGVTAVVMMKDGELSDRLGSSVPVLCGLENGYGEICSQQ